jgi:hypothetical protein
MSDNFHFNFNFNLGLVKKGLDLLTFLTKKEYLGDDNIFGKNT